MTPVPLRTTRVTTGPPNGATASSSSAT
jgi:hypothetical protein